MLKERLKDLRTQRKVTQEQLAEIIGVERSSIGKYEGKQNIIPSVDVLNAIANYFNVTTDYLLGRSDEPAPQLLEIPDVLQDRLFAFNRAEFEGLDQYEVDRLAIYAEGMKTGRGDKDEGAKKISRPEAAYSVI